MERIPEPEIMSTEDEAKVYDLADFSEVNQAFANRVLEVAPESQGVLIDLGCGPGDIMIRIFRMAPQFSLLGLEASKAMIDRGVKKIKKEGLENKIYFFQGDAKRVPCPLSIFGVVISNSLVHHLLDPLPFWREVGRIIKPGGTVLIRDLSRPSTSGAAWDIVEKYSGNEPQLLKDLFFYSLRASFTVEEIKEQIFKAGLKGLEVKMCSDRHWEVAGKIQK